MEGKKINLTDYDHIIIAYSGGKDSTACVLDILESGVHRDKIELWHHSVDGHEGSSLMDWAVTEDYCRQFAKALGLKIYYSWKMGGFEREMLRNNERTAPTKFECPDGSISQSGGDRGKLNTRRKFPQVSSNLSVRWCSAYMKIDVCTTAIRNQARFEGKKTLVITGERAQESTARANYEVFEPHKSDNRNGKKNVRHVDHYRPVHKWLEAEVWDLISSWKINPHPAYKIGWGRLSCAACIFGSQNQWATLNSINSCQVKKIAMYEKSFKTTIQRDKSVPEMVVAGSTYQNMDPHDVRMAMSDTYADQIFVENWVMPSGAFGESCGPS